MSKTPSIRYRSAIYFAVATIHFYSKNINHNTLCPAYNFRLLYNDIVQRVHEECLSILKYELSYEQMDRAILAYIQGVRHPTSPSDTKVYELPKAAIDSF